MAQSILVKSNLSGSFGRSIVDMVIASIGIMGVWLFIVAIFLLSMTLLVESSISDFLTLMKPTFTKTKIKEYKVDEERPSVEEKKVKVIKKQVSLVEEKIMLDDDTPDENPAIIEPLYPENEEPKKPLVRLKSAKKVEILSEVAENTKLLSEIDQGECDKPKDFKLPPLSF